MRINEVVQQVPLTRRAVKFYEEKGLLHVPKDSNGYRNYTEEHIRILQECRQPPLTVIRAILSGQTGTSPAINRYAAKGSLHE